MLTFLGKEADNLDGVAVRWFRRDFRSSLSNFQWYPFTSSCKIYVTKWIFPPRAALNLNEAPARSRIYHVASFYRARGESRESRSSRDLHSMTIAIREWSAVNYLAREPDKGNLAGGKRRHLASIDSSRTEHRPSRCDRCLMYRDSIARVTMHAVYERNVTSSTVCNLTETTIEGVTDAWLIFIWISFLFALGNTEETCGADIERHIEKKRSSDRTNRNRIVWYRGISAGGCTLQQERACVDRDTYRSCLE
jgi:hypothetical protein